MRRYAVAATLFGVLTTAGQAQASNVATPAQKAAQIPSVSAPAPYLPQTSALIIPSRALGQDRPVFVALPRSYASTTRSYPVIFVFDGEAHFPEAAVVVQQMADVGHIPEAIVVGIPNLSGDPNRRVQDLTPPGLSVAGSTLSERGDRMLDFLIDEVMPELASRHRAAPPMILIGHSSGGILATYAAATRGDRFPVVISMDAPVTLQDGWLAARVIAAARGASPDHLRYVTVESRFGWTDAQWADLQQSTPAAWRTRRIRLTGESHNSMIFSGLYEGLKAAFDDYSIVGAPLVPRAQAQAAFAHYEAIAGELGEAMLPPRAALTELVTDLLTEGRTAEARRALAWSAQGYGDRASDGRMSALIAAVEASPPLTETVESLSAAPPPSAEQIRPFLGEWRGDSWINPAARTPLGLRIRLVDGRPVAEIINGSGADERVETATYLNVTTDGLEFGRINGMRPRAMMVRQGVRTGEVLEGEMAFRGVFFPLPGEDVTLPAVRFRLERVADGD